MTKSFDDRQPSPATRTGAETPNTALRQDAAAAAPAAGSALDALAGLLLGDPAVEECFVLAHETGPVAYVVVAAPRDFAKLEQRLRELFAGQVAAFVPLSRLPLTEDGGVDAAALAELPIRSAAADVAWEARLAELPDIDRVACVTGYAETPARHVHVAGLLRTPADTAAVAQTAAAAPSEPSGPRPDALSHGGPLPEVAGAARTLPELLLAAPPQAPITYIDADGGERAETYGSLLREAKRLLAGLRQAGLALGDKVLLQLERNDDILPALWGCLLGGFEPAIVPAPLSYDVDSRALEHLRHLWNLFDRPLILSVRARSAGLDAALQAPARFADIGELRGYPPDNDIHTASPDAVAFYCLSSGSTGLPKAVALTHRNLLARMRGANALCGHSSEDVILNWLPFDHIGSISDWHLRCVALGCALVYAPKEYVLARPLRWLELLHRHRVTHSWAPNFAYALVSAAAKSERRQAFDLSRVKMLLTAGESVTRAATGEFLGALAAYGLAPSALQTAFGMVEVCSGVTYHRPAAGQPLSFRHIDRNSLGGAVRPADPSAADCVSFASLGPIIPGLSMSAWAGEAPPGATELASVRARPPARITRSASATATPTSWVFSKATERSRSGLCRPKSMMKSFQWRIVARPSVLSENAATCTPGSEKMNARLAPM
ncbi:MAG: AMP-binding protein [Candidatus Methylumidiphilus sp.]